MVTWQPVTFPCSSRKRYESLFCRNNLYRAVPTRAQLKQSLTSSPNSRNLKFPNSLKCFEHETKCMGRLRPYVFEEDRGPRDKKKIVNPHQVLLTIPLAVTYDDCSLTGPIQLFTRLIFPSENNTSTGFEFETLIENTTSFLFPRTFTSATF